MTMVDALKLVGAIAPSAPSKSNTRWIPKFSRLFFGPTPLNIRIWGLPNAPADKITSPC
ncbi:hypothetical protein Peur_042898 [Populus x canadensis]